MKFSLENIASKLLCDVRAFKNCILTSNPSPIQMTKNIEKHFPSKTHLSGGENVEQVEFFASVTEQKVDRLHVGEGRVELFKRGLSERIQVVLGIGSCGIKSHNYIRKFVEVLLKMIVRKYHRTQASSFVL